MTTTHHSQPAADRRAGARAALSAPDREVALFWLAMRLFTWGLAVVLGALLPLLPRERALPAWPPSAPLGDWLSRLLLSPWERWDVEYFISIVARGQQAGDGTAQFHPLLSWLATPVGRLSGSPLLGLMLVSSLASLALLIAFERYARLSLPQPQARLATCLLALSPLGFLLFAPYSEGLFLLCAVLCLYWARSGRWALAGLAGGLAVLTRQQGIFLLLPLAWEGLMMLRARRPLRELAGPIVAGALVAAGQLAWMLYRAVALGDLQVNAAGPQELIYSLLISPSSSEVVPNQAFLPPWEALGLAFANFAARPRPDLAVDLLLGLGFLPLVAIAWPRLSGAERVYTLAIVLVSFAYHTGPHTPYMGLPRHLLLAFPVFVGLAARLGDAPRKLLIAGGLCAGIFLQFLYHATTGWVP